jgi:hypothetical protein
VRVNVSVHVCFAEVFEPFETRDQGHLREYLFRYLDEQSFRYNERKATDEELFRTVLGSIAGKRLTYARVTG